MVGLVSCLSLGEIAIGVSVASFFGDEGAVLLCVGGGMGDIGPLDRSVYSQSRYGALLCPLAIASSDGLILCVRVEERRGMAMEIPVAAYGKLPLSKEYLKHACSDGVGGQIRDFVDRGNDRLAAEPIRVKEGLKRRFLWYPSGRECAVGWTLNSRDEGKRKFPFLVFTPVQTEDVAAPSLGRRYQALSDRWSELEKGIDRLAAIEDRDEFFDVVRGMKVGDSASSVAVNGAGFDIAIEEWAQELYDEDGEYVWLRALWRVALLESAIKSGSNSPAVRAFRVPLSSGRDVLQQVDLWSAVISGILPPSEGTPAITSAVWSAEGEPSSAFLIQRSPRTEDFAVFQNGKSFPAEVFTDLVDLSARLSTDGFSSFKSQVEQRWLNGSTSCERLRDFSIA